MDYVMAAFSSTYAALLAQRAGAEVAAVQVMPVLREVSQGCGIALRLPPEALERVRGALAACGLKPEEYAFYAVSGQGDARSVRLLPAVSPAVRGDRERGRGLQDADWPAPARNSTRAAAQQAAPSSSARSTPWPASAPKAG